MRISDWSSDVCSSDLKAIQRELGNEGEDGGDELAELTAKVARTKLSKEARAKATAELKKLKSMQPLSAAATVVRNYLDVLLGLPWGDRKSVVSGKRVQGRVDLGGRSVFKKKKTT